MPISGISGQSSVIRWLSLRLDLKTDQLASIQGMEVGVSDLITDDCLLIPDISVLCRHGGSSGEPEPDPIPNSAVKLPSADGTKS